VSLIKLRAWARISSSHLLLSGHRTGSNQSLVTLLRVQLRVDGLVNSRSSVNVYPKVVVGACSQTETLPSPGKTEYLHVRKNMVLVILVEISLSDIDGG